MSTTTPVTKKPRTTPLLGTHSGTFHCDEALAIFLLRILPQYSQADLIRTRDQSKLDECTVVVDVGGVYDDSTKRYDHHQRGFTENFGNGFVTKLSSAGLVYKHFGPSILSHLLSLPPTSPTIQTLYLKLYSDFIEAIDGIDNGISSQSGPVLYRSNKTDLSSRVGSLNPRWNEPSSDEVLDEQFGHASKLAGGEFLARVDYLAKAWLPAREIVVRALEGRKDVEGSGRVIVFDEFCPWKEHLHSLETELSIPATEQPLYILYPEDTSATTKWRIQAVPKDAESFESRKALPDAWRGIRDQQLDEVSGIDGCVFVHAAGFIGGNKTKEGALKMAIKALEL
ncbi:putative GAMM1 protein [Meredithblackwellia eburnea MCA 4105]